MLRPRRRSLPLSKHSSEPLRCRLLNLGMDMRRREFFGLAGGTIVLPLAARAQQTESMRRIGVLLGLAVDDPQGRAMIATLIRDFKRSAGSMAATQRSPTVAPAIRQICNGMQRNCCCFRRTSWWPPVGRARRRCFKRPRPCPSSLQMCRTPLPPDSSKACRGQVATQPVLCSSNRSEWQVARTAEADCAGCAKGRGALGSIDHCWCWPIRRHSVRGTGFGFGRSRNQCE